MLKIVSCCQFTKPGYGLLAEALKNALQYTQTRCLDWDTHSDLQPWDLELGGGALCCSPDFLTPSPAAQLLWETLPQHPLPRRSCWLFEQQWPCRERSNCSYADSSSAAVSTGCSTSAGGVRPTAPELRSGGHRRKQTQSAPEKAGFPSTGNKTAPSLPTCLFPPTLLCSAIIQTSVSLATLSLLFLSPRLQPILLSHSFLT